MVPKIIGAAPNTPATGSHTEVHTKRTPKRVMAGQALTTSSPTSASSNRGSVRARPVSVTRYTRSATFRPARTGGTGARGGAGVQSAAAGRAAGAGPQGHAGAAAA